MPGKLEIPVRDAAAASRTMLAYEDDTGGLSPVNVSGNYGQVYKDGFNGSSLNAAEWDSSIGAGGAISVAGGALTIGSGTTANAVTSVLLKRIFSFPLRASFCLTLSQRIANQTFLVSLVSVDPDTGVEDGQEEVAWLFDGTTVTNGKFRVKTGGTVIDSAAQTILTTASNSVFEFEPDLDCVWLHQGAVDTVAGRSYTFRKHIGSPNPRKAYKLKLSWVNGATAPASNTNAVIQYVAIGDHQKQAVEITGGRGNTPNGAQATPVAVTNSLSVTATPAGAIYYNETTTLLAASATFTGTSRDTAIAAGSSHRYQDFCAFAHCSSVAGTMRIEASNDNTTWYPVTADTAVAANTPVMLTVPVLTRYHRVVFINGAAAQTGGFRVNSGYRI